MNDHWFILITCFIGIAALIHYACITYFYYKLDHFRKISSEMKPTQIKEKS